MSTFTIEVIGPRDGAGRTTIYRGNAKGCREALDEARTAYATPGAMILVRCSAMPSATVDVFDGRRWRAVAHDHVGRA